MRPSVFEVMVLLTTNCFSAYQSCYTPYNFHDVEGVNGDLVHAGSRSLSLPNEVWMLVAWFLPRMPNEPRWQPWVKYRSVNKVFKKEIEQYYIKHYLEHMHIQVDCGAFDLFNTEFDLVREYTFDTLQPSRKTAIFRRIDGEPHRHETERPCLVCYYCFRCYTRQQVLIVCSA